MKEILTPQKKDIILYKTSGIEEKLCNLKNFIHYLNYCKAPKPYKFSFVESDGALLLNLTLRENLLLDLCSDLISPKKAPKLENYLEKNNNIHLINLFEKLQSYIREEKRNDTRDPLDRYPLEIDDNARKITTLIKALLQNCDYLFLERPEKYLEHEIISTLINAITYQAKVLEQIVLVHTLNEKLWFPYVRKIVYKKSNGKFITTSTILNENLPISSKTEKLVG